MRTIPSSQEFRKFADFVFTFNPSVTKENIPRLFMQATLAAGLAFTGWFLYKCITSYCSSIPDSIKGITTKFFGQETILEKIKKRINEHDVDVTSIKAIEIYGSDKSIDELLDEEFKDSREKLLANALLGHLKKDKKLETGNKDQLCMTLKAWHKLPFIDFSINTYLDGSTYLIFDVVESKDENTRLKFTSIPDSVKIAHNDDPGDLLKKFDEYVNIGMNLYKTGQFEKGEEHVSGTWHTLFGHTHPQLKPYLETFIEGVKKHKEELIDILMRDIDDSKAAKIIFLLSYSYMEDCTELVMILKKRIADQNGKIREHVFRVFAHIAKYHFIIELPFSEILSAINDPLTIVRSKALKTLYHYLSHQKDGYITEVELNKIKEFIPILKKIEKLQQPNNHYFANEILRVLKDHYGIDINKSEKS
ncbi:MAG: hypothetical protein L0207_03385 [Chlamydiae bacterium]|nr:hypothetical protein [Chlamydiota bacterium]